MMALDRRNGVTADNNNAADNNGEESGDEKTRKKSDKNVENYRKIVIADETDASQQYKSDYRGRVQDRNVVIKPEPMYALTYYEKSNEVKRIVHYHKYIDELNRSKLLPLPLHITNMEAPLTEEQVKFHFRLIDVHTSQIVENEHDAKARFLRGMDFYLVQDFGEAIEDFTQSVLLDDTFFPSYFMRALVRFKQQEYKNAEQEMTAESGLAVTTEEKKKEEQGVKDYDLIKNDLDRVIALAPDFVYAYYNRGNVLSQLKDYRAAIVDYDKAISLSPDFAEAYFNRGLTHIFLGNNKQGVADLSKAGELGVVKAYNVIKRFAETPEE
jgi:tetratricopeptide (TPR) repeat protein